MQDNRTLSYKLSQKLSSSEVSMISAGSSPATWCASASGHPHEGGWDFGIDCSPDM